jgi:hypothetical protein
MTGWDVAAIRRKMKLGADGPGPLPASAKWWERLWKK